MDSVREIKRMDHFTIVTKSSAVTEQFYSDILGFKAGPRPNFTFPGVWLYNNNEAVLHVIEKPQVPSESGVLDHIERLIARRLAIGEQLAGCGRVVAEAGDVPIETLA